MNDDNHDNRVCFEDQTKIDMVSAFIFLGLPHDEVYEIRIAYITDIEDRFSETHPDFTNRECSDITENLFNNVMWNQADDSGVYLAAFDDIWELAE